MMCINTCSLVKRVCVEYVPYILSALGEPLLEGPLGHVKDVLKCLSFQEMFFLFWYVYFHQNKKRRGPREGLHRIKRKLGGEEGRCRVL